MAIILLEGLDRTGKSSVAEEYKKQGYKVIHLSAPGKELSAPGYTGPSYLDQMVDLLQTGAADDVVFDRTHYGELIWPAVYDRKPHLREEDFEILRELEDTVGVKRIFMHDPNMEAHWQRCVENKEPLTKAQFLKARTLYERMANRYGFEKRTLADFVTIKASASPSTTLAAGEASNTAANAPANTSEQTARSSTPPITPEQLKLEKANAINDVLSRRILKAKGQMYDELENDIRSFLRDRLGKIFGDTKSSEFSKEEVSFLKLFCQRLKDKENAK